ncbi:hypothetical protein V6N13_106352 [Hibiscus sabdariffa]
MRSPWVLFGDFNSTLKVADRKGCALSTTPSRAFQNLLLDYGLRDMGYQGPDFTWSRGLAHARLDRFIFNSYCDESFPKSGVQHLLRFRSDHRPILLQVGHALSRRSSTPFRYISAWLSHEDFDPDSWNKLVFGYIGTKKRILMARLRGIQKALASHPSLFLHNLESELLLELESILNQEESIWRQKSRSEWISLGDRNT